MEYKSFCFRIGALIADFEFLEDKDVFTNDIDFQCAQWILISRS